MIFKQAKWISSGLVCLFFLCGCQTLTRQELDLTSQQQYLSLANLHTWKASGKIAYKNNQERQNAAFSWKQNNSIFTIHLYGPFGQGSSWIKKTKHGVSFESSDGIYHKAETPEALMQETLGWQVPISKLQQWITGTPTHNDQASDIIRDEQGFITAFKEDGWQISYPGQQRAAGWLLPNKIVISKAETRLVIVVKKWEL